MTRREHLRNSRDPTTNTTSFEVEENVVQTEFLFWSRSAPHYFQNSYIQVLQLLKKLLVHCIPNIEVTFEQLQDVFWQCDGTIRVLITFKHFFRRHFARMVFRSRDLGAKKPSVYIKSGFCKYVLYQ